MCWCSGVLFRALLISLYALQHKDMELRCCGVVVLCVSGYLVFGVVGRSRVSGVGVVILCLLSRDFTSS